MSRLANPDVLPRTAPKHTLRRAALPGFWLLCLALAFALSAGPALAWKEGKPVGYVQRVEGQALAMSAKGLRALEEGAGVYLAETLTLAEGAKLQVILHDGSFLVLAGPAALTLNEFEHEWGDQSAGANHAGFQLATGVLVLECGALVTKHPRGLSVEMPAGNAQLDGGVVGFDVQNPDLDQALAARLAGLELGEDPAQPELAAELLALCGKKTNKATSRAAYLSGMDTHPMAFSPRISTPIDIRPTHGIVFKGVSTQLLDNVADDPAWSRAQRDKKAPIPRGYRIMLGEDWGAGGQGSQGGESGCGC